jgi:hypothetical protein
MARVDLPLQVGPATISTGLPVACGAVMGRACVLW